jgi:Iap family predicted aminopeptidase
MTVLRPLPFFLLLLCLTAPHLAAQSMPVQSSEAAQVVLRERIVGAAFTGQAGYDFLGRVCDEAGGRLIGSAENEKAMDMLVVALRAFGVEARREGFTVPGWRRGEDVVRMAAPAARTLRAVALGYTQTCPPFEAGVVYAVHGYGDEMDSVGVRDRIVLVTQEAARGREELLRSEVLQHAGERGAKAVLFIVERPGGRTLAGMGNFTGDPAPVPGFSLTYEEGQRLRRLLEQGVPVRVAMDVRSSCGETRSANVVATLVGDSPEKIVIGAHYDSWDVSQGAVDNGIGSAILLDVARLFRALSPRNRRTVEFVWFNGEEMGLWGSKRYMQAHAQDSMVAMINLDMTGAPRGFNAMGTDTLLPFLRGLARSLPGFALSDAPVSVPYTNSDHEPFMLHGIPTFGVQAHLDEATVAPYHDFEDTFDKVNRTQLAEAAAVVAVLAHELANADLPGLRARSDAETVALLKKHGIDARLKKQKEWPFGE